jgi:hypothetical protein
VLPNVLTKDSNTLIRPFQFHPAARRSVTQLNRPNNLPKDIGMLPLIELGVSTIVLTLGVIVLQLGSIVKAGWFASLLLIVVFCACGLVSLLLGGDAAFHILAGTAKAPVP